MDLDGAFPIEQITDAPSDVLLVGQQWVDRPQFAVDPQIPACRIFGARVGAGPRIRRLDDDVG